LNKVPTYFIGLFFVHYKCSDNYNSIQTHLEGRICTQKVSPLNKETIINVTLARIFLVDSAPSNAAPDEVRKAVAGSSPSFSLCKTKGIVSKSKLGHGTNEANEQLLSAPLQVMTMLG